MKRHRAWRIALRIVVASAAGFSLLAAVPAVAQPRAGTGQSIRTSFVELPAAIGTGSAVVVWDAAGRRTRGRVSSVAPDRIVIVRDRSPVLRLFGPPDERAYRADAVMRIDLVDSTVNGALIGAAISPIFIYGIHRWEQHLEPDPANRGLMTLVYGGLSVPISIYVAMAIDRAINRPVYLRPPGLERVSVTPRLGRDWNGIQVVVRLR